MMLGGEGDARREGRGRMMLGGEGGGRMMLAEEGPT